jgi:hypothetical protein
MAESTKATSSLVRSALAMLAVVISRRRPSVSPHQKRALAEAKAELRRALERD